MKAEYGQSGQPLQKRLTLVTRPMSAFPETLPEGGSAAAPTVQGGSARESRPGTPNGSAFKPPRRNSPSGAALRDSPDRMGTTPPVLRCKRRSQLPQDRAPVRPYVLHALPSGYAEGDMSAPAVRTLPAARNALGTAGQTPGQHQGRSLVHRQPVTFHELHPADDGTEGRVDLKYLYSIPVAAGDEVSLDLAVAETGQHPAVPAGLAFQLGLLLLEVQPLNHDGLARLPGMLHHPGHRVPDQRLSLMAGPAVGHQRDPPSSKVVAAGVGLGHGQGGRHSGPRQWRRAPGPSPRARGPSSW